MYFKKILSILPTKLYLQIQFYRNYKRFLNFRVPKTYADKLAILKLRSKNDDLSKYVDKLKVRDYIREKIGDRYLIPLIGVYDSTSEIKWNQFPNKYVIKCTHDSGSTLINYGNGKFDFKKAEKILNSKMKKNLYDYSREYPYKNLKPKIICEEFISDTSIAPKDYKFLCFNGVVEYIVVDNDRFINHKRDFYNRDWIKLDIDSDHKQSNYNLQKPTNFDEMVDIAEKLSKDFKHVRVDLYNVNGKVYFGELTFTPWGGVIWFNPPEWNYIIGDKLKI